MGVLSIDNVTKVYSSDLGDIIAVEDLNLEIEDGEFLVLVGPSGCGKSTTLRMVAGLETITEGTMAIGGQIVNGRPPKERNIAMVFQNYALYPHKTVRENMAFGLKYSSTLSTEEMNERVDEAAAMMGIEDLLDDKPGQLSGGQQQRVALGRAIVREPEAFLFDEPLSNLDAKLRTHMRTEISKLQNELGVTSLYVTHNQAEAMTMGDRIAVLNDGVLQHAGTPNEVYEHPANKFVAGFIGSPSMNFAPVTLDERGETPVLADRGDSNVEYPLDPGVREQLAVAEGDSVTLGVRPEDITAVPDVTDTRDGVITATVEVVEPMGSDNFLTVDIGHADSWVARVDSAYTPEEGTQIGLTFEPETLHVFDADGTTLKSQGLDSAAYHEPPLPNPLSQ